MSIPVIDVDALSPEERVRLIGELWDSLADGDPRVPDEYRLELERRSAELDADIAAGRSLGRSWHDVRRRIEARRDSE